MTDREINRIGTAAAGIIGVLLISVAAWAFIPRVATARVQQVQWRYTITWQEKTAVPHEGWSCPGDAFETSSEIRAYSSTCSYPCMKTHFSNGKSHTSMGVCFRSCTKHAPYYHYKQWEWLEQTRVHQVGQLNTPYWPDVPPGWNSEDGDTRYSKTENYEVSFTEGPNATYNLHPETLAEFTKFKAGADWRVKQNKVGYFRAERPR